MGPGGLGETSLVRNTQAMVPEPNDDPEPDDEPDEEPDDEPDDEPEPGTLYFGGGRRMDGPILLKPNITPQLAGGGADTTGAADPISLLQAQCPMTAPAPS